MQARTWLQKLTDESSLWFNAVKAEDNGDFIEAASFYLKDAQTAPKNDSSVRQALSVSCAANCLAQIGCSADSKQLFGEAARLYIRNADRVISESIREALWCLEQAYELLILAGNTAGASELRSQYLAIAARKSPFSGSADAVADLDRRAKEAERGVALVKAMDLPESLKTLVQTTLKSTKQVRKEPVISPSALVQSAWQNGGSRLDEKSIVS